MVQKRSFMEILGKYREEQFELLRDTIYERRGWNANGIPTLETLRRLQMDFPDVVALVKNCS